MKNRNHTNKNNSHTPDDCSTLTQAVSRGEVNLFALARGQYPGERISQGRLPGLRTIGYWDAVGHQSWGLPMHRNEGIEICYLLSGELPFGTTQDSILLRPGDITITRPWQQHRLGNPDIRACRLFWVIIDVEINHNNTEWELPNWIAPDPQSRHELLRIFRRNQRCHIKDEGLSLKPFLLDACKSLKEPGPLRDAVTANIVNHLLTSVGGMLSRETNAQPSDPQGFNHTVQHFFNNLTSSVEHAAEPWTVDEMARACRVGVTYLTSCCKEIFNTTPSEQLNQIRLAHAARMLREAPQKSVTDIAFEIGFNSSQYFATRFRKQHGCSPKQFRENGYS